MSHPRRLMNAQAAIYPPDPLRDPIGAARIREEERRRAVVIQDAEAWTQEVLGRMLGMCMARATRQEIAAAVGRPVEDIARKVSAIQKSLRAWQLWNSSRRKERPHRRTLTEEQIRQSAELRFGQGLSWEIVAREVGATIGQVRYLLGSTDRGRELYDEIRDRPEGRGRP